MPITTTLLEPPPPHRDHELQELLDELTRYSGRGWYAITHSYVASRRIFRAPRIGTTVQLLARLTGAEYQEFTCVKTMSEAKAYLIGAVGVYRAMDNDNKR